MVSLPQRWVGNRERGASDVFMLMLVILLISFAGLAFDMGMLFNTRREATNLAAAAARAAANEVDVDRLYDDGIAVIDPGAALGRADGIINGGDGNRTGWRIDTEDEVWIKVEKTYETVILRIINFDSFVVSGEATIRVQNGEP